MDPERAADFATLDTLRSITRSAVVDPLERTAVLTLTLQHLDRERDRLARAALDTGRNYGDVGRALGMSRQAARKRYPPDPVP